MIRADYHTHSSFSTDSDASAEAMITSAIERGLTHYCFTDHMDLGYPGSTPEKPLFNFDPEAYFSKLEPLKKQYENHIFVGIGVEYGFRPDARQFDTQMSGMLARYPFDFVLGSLHLLNGEDPYYEDYWLRNTDSVKNIMVRYFEQMLAALQNFNDFDSLGHIDYLIRYIPKDLGKKDYVYKEYREVLDEILKLLISGNKALEVNTKGLLSGLACFHPKLEILQRYRELGGTLLTIGSDAHMPEGIAAEFTHTEEMIKSCGFSGYHVYRKRTPEFILF